MATQFPPGWTCEVTILRLESYILRTLSRHEALAVAEHLEACPPCAQLVALRWERRATRG
jgi:anti-sigma factor RsiW